MSALKLPQCSKARTMSSWLYPYFLKEKRRLDAEKEIQENSKKLEVTNKTSFELYKQTGQKSIRNKLRD